MQFLSVSTGISNQYFFDDIDLDIRSSRHKDNRCKGIQPQLKIFYDLSVITMSPPKQWRH